MQGLRIRCDEFSTMHLDMNRLCDRMQREKRVETSADGCFFTSLIIRIAELLEIPNNTSIAPLRIRLYRARFLRIIIILF